MKINKEIRYQLLLRALVPRAGKWWHQNLILTTSTSRFIFIRVINGYSRLLQIWHGLDLISNFIFTMRYQQFI